VVFVNKIVGGVLLLAVLCCSYASAGDFPLWGGLEPGRYGVGFRSLATYDYSRAWNFEGKTVARPIRIFFWYPAASRTSGTFSQYLQPTSDPQFEKVIGTRLRFFDLGRESNGGGIDGLFQKDRSLVQRLLATRVAAARNATPATGRFPIVVYSLGQDDYSQENTVLSEYLASHGYIVFTVPHLGTNERRFVLFIHDPPSYETQLRDLEFALNRVAAEPFADPKIVFAVGHSMGGEYALLLAMRNPAIRAIAGLDPSFVSRGDSFKYKIVEAPYFDARGLRMPMLLQFRSEPESHSDQIVNLLKFADIRSIEYSQLTHGDFSSTPAYVAGAPASVLRADELQRRSPDTARAGSEEVMRNVLRFLDSVRLGKPFEPVTSSLGKFTHRAPIAVPDEEELYRIASSKGVAEAVAAIGNNQAADVVDEARIRALGNEFRYTNRLNEAIRAYELNAQLFLGSARAHKSLALAYEDAGNPEAALVEYRRVLAIQPDDADVAKRIATLEKR
jgi:dienelactone hydrolase